MDKNHKRQLLFFKLFKSSISLILKYKYHFFCKKNTFLKEPIIIISNHCTGLDPVFMGCSFSNHMYYIAGEHVLRMGIASKFIKFMFNPIIKHKGLNDPACIMRIMRTIKAGHNICLFAEGNTSFNGETCEIHPTTAKLIKSCSSLGATLVTFKFSGGYFSKPRWADSFRKGKITGSIVNTYSPEQLKELTDDEINSIIALDLYEDAYSTQEKNHTKFSGKNLAQKLEAALYICPKCGGISTLKSKGDLIYCECGLNAIYNKYGFLEGSHLGFNTVIEWDRWQENQLKILSLSPSNTVIFSDENVVLSSISLAHETTIISKGKIELYADRLILGNWEISISKISELAIHGRENLVFSSGKDYYEIKSDEFFCARKYYSIYKYLKKEN